jgi:hypothetical protein
MRVRPALVLPLVFAFCLVCAPLFPTFAQENHSNRIFETFTGRFHCGGEWRNFQMRFNAVAGPLGIVEDGEPQMTGIITFYFYRSVTSLDGVTYKLKGTRDVKTGRFHMEAKEWYGPHPASLEMYGIEGTFDADTRKMTAKMLSDKCDAVDVVGPGGKLAPLSAAVTPGSGADASPDPKRPELSVMPSNVTNYLDVAAYSPDFLYWVTAWSDPVGTVHEGEPIDEENARMKKDKWVCGDSARVNWDASGTKGMAADRVTITERFVVECVGECKGVTYRPLVGANVTHFGLSAPLPTMQIKSIWFGGTNIQWRFTRTSNTQPAPVIYVHHWLPLTGFGPADPVPAEIARREAAAPPCRAPRAKN